MTVIYFISTTGVSGSNFYCCGKFKESYLFTHFIPQKDCKQDKKTDDCCKTNVFYLKVKDNHAPSSLKHEFKTKAVSLFIPLFPILLSINNYAYEGHTLVILHKPPLLYSSPFYLVNKVFLI